MDLSKMFNPGSRAIVPSSEPASAEPAAGSISVLFLSAEAFEAEAKQRGFNLVPTSQAAAAEPAFESAEERRLRLESYERTDLPPRSPAEIAALLRFENSEETARRISNDLARYAARQQSKGTNPQGAIIDATAQFSGTESWTRR